MTPSRHVYREAGVTSQALDERIAAVLTAAARRFCWFTRRRRQPEPAAGG
ncbi:MAG TPA: hypothetical protein VF070_10195 [Streptosporangiaceae bacterium]